MKTKNFLSQSGGKPDVTRRQNRNGLGSVISRLSLGSIVSRFSLVSLICVLMLTLGVGNAWAVDPTISWAFKTLQTTSGTQDGITWMTGKTGSASATACNATNGLVLYGVSSGGGYFQTTSAISGTITNVNIVSTAKKNTPKYTVYCSADGSNWTSIATNQTAGTKDHAVTGSYSYVKVANTTGATAQLAITSITVTYTASGGSCSECTYYVYNGTTWVSIGTTGFTDVVLAPPTLENNAHGAGNGCWVKDKTFFDGKSCQYSPNNSNNDFRFVPNPNGAAPDADNKPGSGTCELYAVYFNGSGCLATNVTAPVCARIWDEPDNLSVTNVTSSGATLNWDAIAGVSSYHVTVTKSGGSTTSYDVNTNSKTLTGLAAGTYSWTVAANSPTNDACDSNPTDGDDFIIASCTDISGSTVTGVNVTPSKVGGAASWTAVANATSYEVKVYAGTATSGTALFSAEPTSNSCTITGLNASTQYTVVVKAKNSCSTSNQGTKTFTTAAATLYTVTFHNAAGTAPSAVTQTTEGGTVSIPNTTACEGWTFVGWKIGEAQSSTTSDPTGSGTWITSASWPKTYTPGSNIDAYAVFKQTSGGSTPVVDEMTPTAISNPSTYTDWSGKSLTSDAVYAGQSTGGSTYIQIRVKNSNSGVVTTTSGGKCTKVSVTFNASTTNGNGIYVYGKTTAYSGASDLFNSSTYGTQLGTILKGTNTELTISGTYNFIGFRSYNGAAYLDEVDITWGGGGITTWRSDPPCETPKVLTSIEITTPPDRLNYVTGELFDPTGAVVTAHYDDTSTETVTASTSWSPSTALSAGTDKTATASYTEGSVTKTATVTYNVYTPTLAKKDESGTTIDLVSPAISRSAAVVTADATGNSYVFKEWQISGGTFSGETTTSTNPATITSVSGAITVTAVYYKPITVTWYVSGNGSSNIYHTDTHARGWSLMYPSNPDPANYSCDGKVFVGWTSTFPYNNASVAPTFVSSGTTINSDQSYYAVFAEQTSAGTPPTWTKTAYGSVSAGTYLMCTADGHVFNGEISSGKGQIVAAAFENFAANSTFNVDAPIGSCELTFAAVTNGFTMYAAGKGYLYCSESTASHVGWHESESNYWFSKTNYWRYSGAKDNSGNETAIVGYSNGDFRNYVSPGSSTAAVVFLKKTAAGVPATYSNYTTSCACEGFSFHTGTGTDNEVKATNTRTCFVQEGSSTTWKIENYTIPADAKFFVGYQDEFKSSGLGTSSRSSVQTWAAEMYLENTKSHATTRPTTGPATGAVGTLSILSTDDWNNCHVGFQPNGYGITYGGSGHAFATTATANKWETEVVTLTNVSQTYNIGLATNTAGTYVKCGNSKETDEALSAMGVTEIVGGQKKILFRPQQYTNDGAKIGLYNVTAGSWVGFMSDDDGDGIYEGFVPTTCTTIIFARHNSSAASPSWDNKYNQTVNIALPTNGLQVIYTFENDWDNKDGEGKHYVSNAAAHPANGQNGKFRMWDNSTDQNWFVHFIPYFHLTYDGNGGGDAVTNLPASPADVNSEGNDAARTVTVANTDPVRTGYRFMGWADTQAHATAGTVDHAKNTTIVMTGDKTIYAVWKPVYAVTYNLDGGSASPACSDDYYIQGESVTVCTSTPTKAGCDFVSWSYSPSVTVTAGAFTMPASAVTITATWADHTYALSHTGSNFTNTEGTTTIKSSDTPLTLHYTCTGSYGFPNNVTITGGGKATWTKDTHYTWTVGGDKKSATLVITPATTISANVDIAITMATTYTVTYVHHDKGTYSGASTTEVVFSNDNVITLPTVTGVSCGLYDTFEGWIAAGSEYSESTSKPATVYAGGASYTVTADVTLRALYSKCEGDGGQVYRKIASTGAVTAGTYILVSGDPRVYSSHEGTNTYGSSISGLTADGDDFTSTLPSGAQQVSVTLGTGDNAGKFAIYNAARTKYLTYSGSSNTLNESSDVVYKWTLTDGTETINTRSVPAGVLTPDGGTARVIQCNSGSSYRFACYTNNASYNHVFLYKLIDKCTKSYATNPSCIKPTGVHIVYNANALDATMSCSTSNRTYKVQDAQNKYPQLASQYDFCENATRTGYTLVGWNTQANGLGTTYNLYSRTGEHYSSLPVSGDLDGENWVTLNVYAMWASAVSFNLGNATGGTGVPAVVEADGGFMLPEPTAAQLGTIPCDYSFYGWSESPVTAQTTKPTLFMPGTKYTGAARTLYAVYRKASGDADPNLFALSYTYNSTKYYVAAPADITTAPSTWNSDKAKKFVASTNEEDAVAFGMKTNADYTDYKVLYWLYDGDEDEKVYMSWSSGANVTFMNSEDTYYDRWTITGTTTLTFLHKDGRYLSGDGTEIGCPSSVGVSSFTKESVSGYTYATNPTCYTTATLTFVTNGGTPNYPTSYTSANYEDLAVPTTVYLPTATYAGEWEFEGWMKGSPVSSQTEVPTGANFYPVTLNTTQYTADAVGETYFYAVYSKTVNDKQFDPDHEGTYKLFAIMSDGTTKKYMPVWGGTQTTLTPVTNCASTGDYTITPGTGDHAGQYKITHGSYTLGVQSDSDTKFKNDANAWWNIEASTSGKGTYRITIVGSSNRCMSHGGSGTGSFGNYTRNDVSNPSQSSYRDMEIGECIYTEYTSTPENIPYITITGSPVKITSTNGERVYAPTKIHIEAHNFSTTRTIHFSATNGFATDPASVNTAANGAYSGDINIYYQPSAAGDGSIITSVLTASQDNGPAAERTSQTFTAIKGRNMPQDFVIAVKSGTQWYALPDDCHGSGTPKAVAIEVNDDDAPTAASLVPHNVEWRLSDVVSTRTNFRDKVYFYEPNSTNNYTLYAGSAPNIQTNAQLSNVTGDNSYTYEWGLTTSDLCAYTISNANENKNISINTAGTFGTHATNKVSETLYLLPITAYYEAAEFQVVEWKANSVVVMYLGNATQASVQVGSNDEGSNQTLSSVKVDHGVYELAASGLTSAYFEPLQIVFKNAGGTEIGRNYVTIPAIINGNVLTSTYESVKDLAESNDVVILKNSKLTTTGTGTDGTSYKFTNVTVYGGGKLDIASGTKLSVTGSLILRAGGVSSGTYEYIYPQMNLGGTLTNSSGKFYYEYVTDYTRWYHFVLPFDALTSTIKYPTEYYGSAVAANNTGSWVIKRYDGATRATGNVNAWVDIESKGEPTPTTVIAGQGYIFWGAPKKVTANGVTDRQAWGIQRIAMSKGADAAKTSEAADKNVTISSYSSVENPSTYLNDLGWNLVGNPYMVNLTGLTSTALVQGKLEKEIVDGKWTGKWVNNGDGTRYVTIPSDHFNTYVAKTTATASGAGDFMPGRAFFIQVTGDATALTFAAANRASLMPALLKATATDVETGIVMSNSTLKDEVNFWIKDGKTAEYENNADYPKTPNQTNFNIYGVHSHGDLSWVAISPEIAATSMAIGYQVPAAGTYTLTMSETYVSDEVESLFVTDHAVEPEKTVDLLAAPYMYEFNVNQAETNNTRFTVSIVLKEEAPGDPDSPGTGLDQTAGADDKPVKFIWHDKMYILNHGIIYDATGKKVREINK